MSLPRSNRLDLTNVTVATHAAGPCSRCYKYNRDYLVAYTREKDHKCEIWNKVPHLYCPKCVDEMRASAAQTGSPKQSQA